MAWRPKYTEEERAIRHWMRYGEYPPPPRRFRKQAWDGAELGQADKIVIPRDFLRSEDRRWLLWLGIGFLAGYLVGRLT